MRRHIQQEIIEQHRTQLNVKTKLSLLVRTSEIKVTCQIYSQPRLKLECHPCQFAR